MPFANTCRLHPDRGTPLEFRLAPGQALTIGRSHENTLVLDDPGVSARHARILHLDEGWLLTDLDSKNGSLVNGLPITIHWLSAGEILQLGGQRFRFEPVPENTGQEHQ
ncbi:FHA domain-containing protein [Megalodesulfovibrio paquesii]